MRSTHAAALLASAIALAACAQRGPTGSARTASSAEPEIFRRVAGTWSDFYLYYLPSYRVKVRATYAPGAVAAQVIAEFAAQSAPAFAGNAESRTPIRRDGPERER